MKRRDFLALGAALLPCNARSQDVLEAMRFSSLQSGAPLPDWLQPYVFPSQPRHTQFTLVEDSGRVVLGARASASSSGLVRAPAGTIAPNAYTDRVRMVVAESGSAELGRWVSHERDFAADFRRAFGIEPPFVSALIVSADTDNTGETTESYFGDIEFRAR